MEDSFSIDALKSRLQQYPAAETLLVGFSGGIDSTALLLALHSLSPDLEAGIKAIHFNHGLDPACAAWELRCREFCKSRAIDLDVEALNLDPQDAGLESRARALRYAAVERRIDSQTLYLTAHNLDDRVETFLLHALRGSGADGLASIPEVRPLGAGHVARPLLDTARRTLQNYLLECGVEWIEDPANQDNRFDRNFIRNEVIPLLETRWPAAKACLARSSSHLRATASALDALLTDMLDSGVRGSGTLTVDLLFRHGEATAPLILRAWLRRRGAPTLPLARQKNFLAQLDGAGPASRCEVKWSGWALRLFRGQVHLLPPGDMAPCPEMRWSEQVLNLGPGLGALTVTGPDTKPHPQWHVGPRRPGARIRLNTAGPARKLKKVMQELPIPPWLRPSIPVVYWGQEAVAIGDWLLSPRLADWLEQSRQGMRWSPADPSLVSTRQLCHEHLRPLALDLQSPLG